MKSLPAIFFIFLVFFQDFYAGINPQNITAHKIKDLKIDGKLDEPEYKIFIPADKFYQREPDEGMQATEKTHAWVFYNESYLFICGKMYDKNPDSIDVSLSRRDNGFGSDSFWAFLDPYRDKKTGYVFVVSAGGSILDGTIYNDTKVDFLWDGIWLAETSVDSEGWNFEMKIPFSQLRFNNTEEMVWGINLNRDIKRKQEQSFTTLIPRKEGIFASGFGELRGLKNIKPVQRFEALPYVVNKIQAIEHKNNDPFYRENLVESSMGIDLKLGLGTNLTIDATVNPDFGQVEVDPAVINLTAFETFFQEKRPFFVEGASIFSFGQGGRNNNWEFGFGDPQLFYSRRIGRAPQGKINSIGFSDFPNETRILTAAKLTGKIDESWSIGGLGAVTERTFARVQTNNIRIKHEVEPLTSYGVIRTQKEFNKGKQALGVILTSVTRNLNDENIRNQLGKYAFTFGTDGWTYLDKDETFILTGSFIKSYTYGSRNYLTKLQKAPYRYFQRPDVLINRFDSNRVALDGWFSRLTLNKQKGNFYINASVGAISPEFEYNDLGSQWFGDEINGTAVVGYRWFNPDNISRTKNIYFASFRNYDFEGNLLTNGLYASGNIEFLNYYGLNLESFYNFESFNRTLTRGGPLTKDPQALSLNLEGYTDNRLRVIFSPKVTYWNDKTGSKGFSYGFDIEWKPSSQIYFSLGPEYSYDFEKRQWIGNYSDDYAAATYNHRYVFGELKQQTLTANIRLNWTFTPTVSLQLFIQPLIAVGDYNNFKELAHPSSMDFNYYNSLAIFDIETNSYIVDPDQEGPSPGIKFDDPDFNIKSFKGNVVFRVEVSPGSIFYFVWTRDKMNFDNPGSLNFQRDIKNLWNAESNDIFLIKFSYWFDTHSFI